MIFSQCDKLRHRKSNKQSFFSAKLLLNQLPYFRTDLEFSTLWMIQSIVGEVARHFGKNLTGRSRSKVIENRLD